MRYVCVYCGQEPGYHGPKRFDDDHRCEMFLLSDVGLPEPEPGTAEIARTAARLPTRPAPREPEAARTRTAAEAVRTSALEATA